MFQDSKGRLFISTLGGLSIYDGSRFTNYTTDNGLATSLVNDIIEMGDDSIWIVPNTDQIQFMTHGVIKNYYTADHFCPVINQLIKCSDGFFYAISDNGLFRFEKNCFNKIPLVDSSGKRQIKNLVHALENDGLLFMFTDPSNNEYPGMGTLIVYNLKTQKNFVSKNKPPVYFLTPAPDGNILVSALAQQGVLKIDKQALRKGKIEFVDANAQYHIPANTRSGYIFFDRDKNLWLLNNKGVLKVEINGATKLFHAQNGLSENSQVSLFEDKENIIWLMGAHTGISKIVTQQLEMHVESDSGFRASDIYGDSNSNALWIYDSTHRSILVHNDNIDMIFIDRDNFSFDNIFCFGQSVYLIKERKIYKANFEKQHHRFTASLLYNDSMSRNGFSCLLDDHAGNVIAVSDKLVALIHNGSVITTQLGYLADQAVLAENYLWVATRMKKLFLYKINPQTPENYFQLLNVYDKEFSSIAPRSITTDKHGNVWVGTRDRGLFCFAFQHSTLQLKTHLTTKDGLSENYISYLHCDSSNFVWACSPAGLDKVITKKENYYIENITRGNNIYQSVHKIVTLKNGTHWVRTANGLISFTNDDRKENKYTPRLLFTQIKVGDSIIFNTNNVLRLKYSQNNISFSIAAPTFYDEKQTRFSYMLSGSSNNKWSDTSTRSEINFFNLEPGSYKLGVKAIFLNGRYPVQNAGYSFIISPPWWLSWWFRLLSVAALIAITILIIVNYYNRKLDRQRSTLEKKQAIEKERTRIATDMHDDLGSGLSSIRFLSEKVKRNTFSDVTKNDIDKILLSSSELMDKMNEIVWAINEKNDSLPDLLVYIRSYAKQYCEEHGLRCDITIPENIPTVFVSGEIRRNVFLTIKESLHNIFKHAGASAVEIGFHINTGLSVLIRDNGKGFDMDDNKREPGGNGLKNMRKRIESIAGRFKITNSNGLVIEIQVPLPGI
jgi:signal transduction histidine kinase